MFDSAPSPHAFNRNRRVQMRVVLFSSVNFQLSRPIIPSYRSHTYRVVTTLRLIMSTTIMRNRRINGHIRVIRVIRAKISHQGPFLNFSSMTPRVHRISLSQLMMPSQVPKSRLFPLKTSVDSRFKCRVQVNRLRLIYPSVRMESVRHFTGLISRRFRCLRPF